MPALDALTAKAIFLDEMRLESWSNFLDSYLRSMTGKTPGTASNDYWPSEITTAAATKRLNLATQMSHAYYVAPTMQVLVTAASQDLPEDEIVREDDFPQPQGWLYVPGGGITTIDIRGNPTSTSVIIWDCYGGGVDLHYLADKRSPADLARREQDPEQWDALPYYTPWHHMRVEFGRTIPTAMVMGKAIPPEIASQIQIINDQKSGNVAMWFPEGWRRDEMVPHVSVEPVMAWLLSCLRIMQQPMASIERQGLPANYRAGLKKYRIRMKNTVVSVIEYRRREGEYQHDTGRTLSHRYFRRGHWRRQNYKDSEGVWQVKSVRIQPTIVGDPALPLMLREHVNALIR